MKKSEENAAVAGPMDLPRTRERKVWHAPKFMVSLLAETSNTSSNSLDHHGGSIS